MQKHVNLVDLVKSFRTNIFLQNLASIQKKTSPTTFDHFAEKSDKGSISNLSTKARARAREPRKGGPGHPCGPDMRPAGRVGAHHHALRVSNNFGVFRSFSFLKVRVSSLF